MRKIAKGLAVTGLALACTIITFWAMKGANLGWTKLYTTVEHVDPVTEISYAEQMPGFLPGVDFLLLAPLAAVILLGAAGALVLFDSKRKKSSNQPTS